MWQKPREAKLVFLLVVVQGTVQQTTDEEVTCVFNVSLEPGMGEVVQHML